MADITNTVLSPQLHQFWFWCQKVLPLVYDDSLSYYEVLCKAIDMLNNVIDGNNAIIEQVNQNTEDIQTLKEFMDNLDLDTMYQKLEAYLQQWINCYIGKSTQMVLPYLDDDGYFCICIPDNWYNVEFDTCMDFSSDYYGHLMLSVYSDGTVENAKCLNNI